MKKIGPGAHGGAHPKFVQVDPPLDKKSVWVRHLILTQVAKVNYGMFHPILLLKNVKTYSSQELQDLRCFQYQFSVCPPYCFFVNMQTLHQKTTYLFCCLQQQKIMSAEQ